MKKGFVFVEVSKTLVGDNWVKSIDDGGSPARGLGGGVYLAGSRPGGRVEREQQTIAMASSQWDHNL